MMISRLTGAVRDYRAIHRMRSALRLLWADESLVQFDPSKDRQAFIPGQSRRKKFKPKQTGREGALKALKERLKTN